MPDAAEPLSPDICRPCHGTGTVVSGKGGESHSLTCPWCGGTGRFDPARNAQDHPAEPTG